MKFEKKNTNMEKTKMTKWWTWWEWCKIGSPIAKSRRLSSKYESMYESMYEPMYEFMYEPIYVWIHGWILFESMYKSYRNPIGILQAFHRNPYRNPCRNSIGTLQAACSLQELWYNTRVFCFATIIIGIVVIAIIITKVCLRLPLVAKSESSCCPLATLPRPLVVGPWHQPSPVR